MVKGAEIKNKDNSFGVASVVLGILSIIFSFPPIAGIVLGVISLVFATKQQNRFHNKWGKTGKILSIIGIILSIILWVAVAWLQKNPDFYNQLLQGSL